MHKFRFIGVFMVYAVLISVRSTPLPERLPCPEIWASNSFPSASTSNPSDCSNPPKELLGWQWGMGCLFAVVLVLLTGALAGLTLAVMSVDVTRLRVWHNTGGERQRFVLRQPGFTYDTYSFRR